MVIVLMKTYDLVKKLIIQLRRNNDFQSQISWEIQFFFRFRTVEQGSKTAL